MVFVVSLPLTALMLVCLVISINILILFGKNMTPKSFLNHFLQHATKFYLNSFFVVIFLFFTYINSTVSIVAVVITTTLFSYNQHNLWASVMQQRLDSMPPHIKNFSFERLSLRNYIITHKDLHTYLYDLFSAELSNFSELIKSSIYEFKLAIYLVDPVENLTKQQEKLYELQRKVFKYVNVDDLKMNYELRTDEDVLKAYSLWKRNRDPRETLNRLRRLPWKFDYESEPSVVLKLVTTNIVVFYNFFKTTVLAVLLACIYFIYTIFFFKIQFLKQLSVWFVVGMLYFWLMSGFNFFLKRYQYGKFTSQIQRFWKRTNTYFWLIEGFLLLLFFYYYLNSSQEPLYMYDYSAINQEYLVSLHTIGLNVIILSLVVYFMYFTLLRLNSNSWSQISLHLIVISTFIFFSFFIESYQFYYIISVFNERLWVFNEEENLWVIDIDNPILRTKHQYLLVCLIAKYWHFLFIFLSWVFFLIKSFERQKITYVLFGANLQNMIILYALNFACYLQWFKWIYRRFFDLPYTWFFINIDNKFLVRLFFEIKLLALNLLNFETKLSTPNLVVYKSLNLWHVDSLCLWKFV